MDDFHNLPVSESAHTERILSPPIPALNRLAFEQHRLLPTGVLLTLLLCVITLLIGQLTFVVHVKVDGELVGALSDAQSFEELFDTAHTAALTLLGDPSVVEERVSYTYRLAPVAVLDTLDARPVERELFERIDGISIYYAVTVDGTHSGHVAEPATLRLAMAERLAYLESDDSVLSASFLSEVSFDSDIAEQGEALTIAEILELVDGLSVQTVREVSISQTIPFETDIIEDDSLFDDEYELVREGVAGELEIFARVTYIDGREVGQIILDTKIIADAVTELMVEGTLERPLTASWGEYIWPTTGPVSSFFGPRRVSIGSSNHQGIDITAPHGTPVYAADGGEVIFAGVRGGFGNLIKIEHDNGHITYYAHLSSMYADVGERVYRGQHIGGVGMTGTASGNHLHFEIRIDGVPVDPIPWLP